ncbi:hypothetical protein EVA_13362 [gut metagenome]|uniref:Uncharacterized protein n=1 Tax=gut metagenome TaxID=749906 RepID=J9G9V6_9ZZZZ
MAFFTEKISPLSLDIGLILVENLMLFEGTPFYESSLCLSG